MNNGLRRLILASVALAFAWLLVASAPLAGEVLAGEAGMPLPPLSVDLKLSDLPGVGKPTQLTATVNAVADAPGTTVLINLPNGARQVSGDLAWQGDLKAGQSATFSATILFEREDEFEITASAQSPIDANNTRLGEGALAIQVGQQFGRQVQSVRRDAGNRLERYLRSQ